MVQAQDGDVRVIDDPSLFPEAPVVKEVKVEHDGWVSRINTEECGLASVLLGAGRQKLGDEIDCSAGIVLEANLGSRVAAGETIAKLYTSDPSLLPAAELKLKGAVEIGPEPVQVPPLIHARVTRERCGKALKGFRLPADLLEQWLPSRDPPHRVPFFVFADYTHGGYRRQDSMC